MEGKLPPQFYKPVIRRPEFDARLPNQHIKRQTVIRGSTGRRCQWCNSLLPLDDNQCTACGGTQIDTGSLDLSNAPDWKKRIKGIGGDPRRGYGGV